MMKRIVYITGLMVCIFMLSCNSSEAANKMANEMCEAMEKYRVEEPMSMLDAANDMSIIQNKKEEYGNVTQGQLKKAMLKKCPEGWKKYEVLKGK